MIIIKIKVVQNQNHLNLRMILRMNKLEIYIEEDLLHLNNRRVILIVLLNKKDLKRIVSDVILNKWIVVDAILCQIALLRNHKTAWHH